MKKIVAIMGSMHKKGAGTKTLELFKSQFDQDEYVFDTIYLSDNEVQPCIGCTVCFKTSECFKKDSVPAIIEKMKEADGLVFVTPVYTMNISGLLKTFIDRISFMLHKPALYEKHSFILITSDLGGFKFVSIYMNYIMNGFSIHNVGYLGVLAKRIAGDETYKKTLLPQFAKSAARFEKAINLGNRYKPSFIQLIRFNLWKTKAMLSKDFYPGDYQYWVDKEWLTKDYYYPVKINFFHKAVLKVITKIIRRKIAGTFPVK
jgi:multimeric flavodoxin WrbA